MAFYLALILALSIGASVGVQSTLIGRTSTQIGPLQTSLLVNIVAGLLAGLLMVALRVGRSESAVTFSAPILQWGTVIGALTVLTVIALGYAVQSIGVSATLIAVISGQMVVATIVDALGLSGIEPVPVTPQRIIGLLLLVFATFFLLPRE